jgi:hypothetical protein
MINDLLSTAAIIIVIDTISIIFTDFHSWTLVKCAYGAKTKEAEYSLYLCTSKKTMQEENLSFYQDVPSVTVVLMCTFIVLWHTFFSVPCLYKPKHFLLSFPALTCFIACY